jgi:hypothetical protein
MASLSDRIKKFIDGPQGRKLIEAGQRQLAKPDNQRKLRDLASKLGKRR